MSYLSIFNSLWKQTELNDELKKAYKKIQSHDKMQRDFINIAAHELRTPIQSILGFSKIVRDRIQDNEQNSFLSIVIKNANRLKQLTEDILDITRIEGNKLFLNKESVCIWDLLYSIMKEFGHSLESVNKKVRFKLYFKNIDLLSIIINKTSAYIDVIKIFIVLLIQL